MRDVDVNILHPILEFPAPVVGQDLTVGEYPTSFLHQKFEQPVLNVAQPQRLAVRENLALLEIDHQIPITREYIHAVSDGHGQP